MSNAKSDDVFRVEIREFNMKTGDLKVTHTRTYSTKSAAKGMATRLRDEKDRRRRTFSGYASVYNDLDYTFVVQESATVWKDVL